MTNYLAVGLRRVTSFVFRTIPSDVTRRSSDPDLKSDDLWDEQLDGIIFRQRDPPGSHSPLGRPSRGRSHRCRPVWGQPGAGPSSSGDLSPGEFQIGIAECYNLGRGRPE